jgi:hypothetical protein
MSVRSSTGCPRICSGAMLSGVPSTWLLAVRSWRGRPRSSSFTIPKSTSFTVNQLPCGTAITFWALRSRWTIPRSCAAASPEHSSSIRVTVSAGDSGPRAASSSSRFRPSSHSMAMKGRATPASPHSST